jgi:hypothetical protein
LTGGTLTGGLIGTTGSFSSSGSGDTFTIGHTSGSGIALNITKNGNGEGLYINKASGSGNAATIVGNLSGTTGSFSGILTTPQVKAATSAGLSINANSGTQVADFGAGGSANITFFGGLNGTSASFSGQVNSATKYAWGSSTTGTTGQIATDGTNNFFDYLGTLFIRNAAASANRLILTSTGNLTIGTTEGTGAGSLFAGASTFTGALSGTSASFTSSVTSNRGSDTPSFIAIGSGNGNGKIQLSGSTNYFLAGGTDYGGLSFISGGSEKLLIANNGVSTFSSSSSIIANSQGIRVYSTNSQAADLGGGISFGGYYVGTSTTADFANIKSGKDNSTSGNYSGYLAFSTNNQATGNVERMRITSGGEICINQTSVEGQLTVNALTRNVTALRLKADAGSAAISIAGTGSIRVDYPGVGAGRLELNDAGTLFLRQYGNGTVSIVSGQVISTSNINLKNDDGGIEDALSKVLKLNPRYFYWKEDSGIDSNERQLGFYAQEVQEALGEEVANDNGNGKWGVNDRGIIAMLTKAIQEQQAQIEELKAMIAAK